MVVEIKFDILTDFVSSPNGNDSFIYPRWSELTLAVILMFLQLISPRIELNLILSSNLSDYHNCIDKERNYNLDCTSCYRTFFE